MKANNFITLSKNSQQKWINWTTSIDNNMFSFVDVFNSLVERLDKREVASTVANDNHVWNEIRTAIRGL